jgi:hypothetical protein
MFITGPTRCVRPDRRRLRRSAASTASPSRRRRPDRGRAQPAQMRWRERSTSAGGSTRADSILTPPRVATRGGSPPGAPQAIPECRGSWVAGSVDAVRISCAGAAHGPSRNGPGAVPVPRLRRAGVPRWPPPGPGVWPGAAHWLPAAQWVPGDGVVGHVRTVATVIRSGYTELSYRVEEPGWVGTHRTLQTPAVRPWS